MLGETVSLMDGIIVTVFSMSLVFVALLVISFILDIFEKLFYKPVKKVEKAGNTSKNEPQRSDRIITSFDDEIDLVAALTAVIAASNGDRKANVRIKSIKRIG